MRGLNDVFINATLAWSPCPSWTFRLPFVSFPFRFVSISIRFYFDSYPACESTTLNSINNSAIATKPRACKVYGLFKVLILAIRRWKFAIMWIFVFTSETTLPLVGSLPLLLISTDNYNSWSFQKNYAAEIHLKKK